jgi:hypothetical protein
VRTVIRTAVTCTTIPASTGPSTSLRRIDDVLRRWFSAGVGTRRLVVTFCAAVLLVALAVRYPDAFRDANESARANAALDLVDRAIGAGNSVFSDQALLVEARGLIPPDESFAVAVGPPQPGWTELTATAADPFLRSFLSRAGTTRKLTGSCVSAATGTTTPARRQPGRARTVSRCCGGSRDRA